MEHSSSDLLFEDKSKERLVVTFGGIQNGIGMPLFEFKGMLSSFENYNQAFLRDSNQSWYHSGVEDLGGNIDDLLIELKKLIKPYKKVVFIGNSMGGYAAILFGVLLEVESVIAFSPQTFIGKYKRFIYRDKRWSKQISELHNARLKNKFYDLKKVLKNNSVQTEVNVFYSLEDKLDKIHSERLNEFKNVYLNNYNFGGHKLVSVLKESGHLHKILNEALS